MLQLRDAPVMVPWICVPFFSSMVTVSLDSFIKNLGHRQGGEAVVRRQALAGAGRCRRCAPDELHGAATGGEPASRVSVCLAGYCGTPDCVGQVSAAGELSKQSLASNLERVAGQQLSGLDLAGRKGFNARRWKVWLCSFALCCRGGGRGSAGGGPPLARHQDELNPERS